MKYIMFFFFLFHSVSYSASIKVMWSNEYKKYLKIVCNQDDSLCSLTCSKENICLIEEEVCEDCIGDNWELAQIFKNMGTSIKASEFEARNTTLSQLLQSGRFLTLTPKSLYNAKYKFNSLKLRGKFRRTCPSSTLSQTLIVKINKDSSFDPLYINCDDTTFEVDIIQ